VFMCVSFDAGGDLRHANRARRSHTPDIGVLSACRGTTGFERMIRGAPALSQGLCEGGTRDIDPGSVECALRRAERTVVSRGS